MEPTVGQRIALEFMARYLSDKQAGRVGALSDYLRMYPGHEATIAQEYFTLEYPSADWESITDRERGQESVAGTELAAPNRELFAGQRIGRYELIRELGRGGQAIVYLALDPHLRREVALKLLHAPISASDEQVLRFHREAQIAARLDLPGICSVFDVGDDRGLPYFAMEYIEGETLNDRMKSRKRLPSDPSVIREEMVMMARCARIVQGAHENGVLHRDIKPANIMVRDWGEPVLLDLGLARDRMDVDLTRTNAGLKGTPIYMSPEQISGHRVDAQADVYSLSATFYALFTGAPPFSGATLEGLAREIKQGELRDPCKLNPALPKDFGVILMTGLERDLGRRYRDATSLARDLERVIVGDPIAARPPGLVLRTRRFVRRHPTLVASALILLAALTAGLIMSTINAREESRLRNEVTREANQRQVALERFLQTASSRDVNALLEEEHQLHPAGPQIVPDLENWMRRASAELSQLDSHQESRRVLASDARLGLFTARQRSWLIELIDELIERCQELSALHPKVEDRLKRASTLVDRSITAHADAWRECSESIKASTVYDGLELSPQLGLIPLSENEDSGLWSFWHVESGGRPTWDRRRRRWYPGIGSGLVFVLIPGGEFRMGEVNPIQKLSSPPHSVTLDPFFISAYEMTQDQWARLTGINPSVYHPGSRAELITLGEARGETIDLLHPVENVSWGTARHTLLTLGLLLPTEAQWELAARGGTETTWCSGNDPKRLHTVGNVAGSEYQGGTDHRVDVLAVSDGRLLPSRVGARRPNPFGIYDCHGNVWEWCRDPFIRRYQEGSHEAGSGVLRGNAEKGNRTYRGGSFKQRPLLSTSAARGFGSPTEEAGDLGLRPARPVER